MLSGSYVVGFLCCRVLMLSGLVRNSMICRTTVHRASAIAVKAQGNPRSTSGQDSLEGLYIVDGDLKV